MEEKENGKNGGLRRKQRASRRTRGTKGIRRVQRRTSSAGLWALAALALLFLGGCGTRELEDRGFPLAVGIDKEEEGMALSFDFPDLSQGDDEKNPSERTVTFSVEAGAYYEAQKAYENNTNKVLDYNHLKAIILSQEFLGDNEALRELLSWLEHEQVVARNTYLFVAKDRAAEILTLTEGTGGSVGKYLEQMVNTQEDFKEQKAVTIGDLMNQWHNQNEELLLPVLTDNGEAPSITEYAVLGAFSYRGNISVEEAMKAFLSRNQVERFWYELKEGQVVEIQNIRREIRIYGQGDKPAAEIELTGEARMKMGDEGASAGKLEKQLNRQLAESLAMTAEKLLKEPGTDMSNSFIKLGGYNRDLYEKYRQDYEGYLSDLRLLFSVDVKLVNE